MQPVQVKRWAGYLSLTEKAVSKRMKDMEDKDMSKPRDWEMLD